MTLQELNEHYQLREQLAKAKEMLTSLRRAAVPGAQVITGMPHAPGISDKVGNLAVEIADLETRIECLQSKIMLEEVHITAFIDSIASDQTRMIFRLRFMHGLAWGEVATIIGGGNSANSVKLICYRQLKSQN